LRRPTIRASACARGGPASARSGRAAAWRHGSMAADPQPYERGARVEAARLSGPSPLRRFMLASMASLSYPGTRAEQLLLAPQELRTADPTLVTELYHGHFGLPGKLAEVDTESPFEVDPPSAGWA